MSAANSLKTTQSGKHWVERHPFTFLGLLLLVSLVVLIGCSLVPMSFYGSLWVPSCVAGVSSLIAALALANSRWSWLVIVYMVVAFSGYTLFWTRLVSLIDDWNLYNIVI